MKKKNENVKICQEIIEKNRVISPIWDGEDLASIIYEGGRQTVSKQLEFNTEKGKQRISMLGFRTLNLSLPTNVGNVANVDELIGRAYDLISKISKLPDEQALIFASLFVVGSWNYDSHSNVCYMAPVGPPGSGKSTFLQGVSHLSFNALRLSGSASDSSIFRAIDGVGGTLCLEEAQKSANDPGTLFHKMLVDGNNEFGNVPRVAQNGNKLEFTPEVYSIFGPKVLCGRSIPGDDAVLDRCFEIKMRKLSTEDFYKGNFVKPNDKGWLREAEQFRNDMLLYRQRRLMGEVDIDRDIRTKIGMDRLNELSQRDIQVYEWMMGECPPGPQLDQLFTAIVQNKKRLMQSREEHIEPTVLVTIFDLLNGGGNPYLYLQDVSNEVLIKYGLKLTPKQISRICEENDLERMRRPSGRYIAANSDVVAKKLVGLGFSDPRIATSATSAASSPSKDDEEGF